MIQTTYTEARANFARLLERAGADRQTVIIRRRGHEDVALIAASELAGLAETAHLLRSPKNAQRLLRALKRAKSGRRLRPQPVESLRREVGIGDER
jgi:antitoxin YefM